MFPTENPIIDRAGVARALATPIEMLLASIDFDAVNELVLASGSIVEGLSNEESDLDIFVLSTSRARSGRYFYVGDLDLWIDEIIVPLEKVESLVQTIHERRVWEGGWGRKSIMTHEDLDLVYRLTIGVPLNDPLLPAGFEVLSELDLGLVAGEAVYYRVTRARQLWKDAVGAMRSGHLGQAFCAAKLGSECIVDAYSALQGSAYQGHKWTWSKLHRLDADPLGFRDLFPDFGIAPEDLGSAASAMTIFLAEGLLQIMWFVEHGEFLAYEHDVGAMERYELHEGSLVVCEGVNLILIKPLEPGVLRTA